MSELSQRLAALRSSVVAKQPAPRDDSCFPLSALIALYACCGLDNKVNPLYLDHFEGFKLLVDWLQPIAIQPAHQVPAVPGVFVTYEIQEIAKIFNCDYRIIYYEFRRYYHDHDLTSSS